MLSAAIKILLGMPTSIPECIGWSPGYSMDPSLLIMYILEAPSECSGGWVSVRLSSRLQLQPGPALTAECLDVYIGYPGEQVHHDG